MFIKKELDYSILWQFNVTQKKGSDKRGSRDENRLSDIFPSQIQQSSPGWGWISEYRRLLSAKAVIRKSDIDDIRQINCRIHFKESNQGQPDVSLEEIKRVQSIPVKVAVI